MFEGISFQQPWLLLLLICIPLLYLWDKTLGQKRQFRLGLPSLEAISVGFQWRVFLLGILPYVKYLSLAFIIIALSRPRSTLKEEIQKAEGIDIFLVMDLSSSMLAKDFSPDRLEVSKRVAADFVNKRPFDRIGLAVFAAEAYTQSPLTTDHHIIRDFLSALKCGYLEDGTAIGMGLAAAVNRLKDSDADSKVIILLTDGVNNAGYIKPMTAAEIAEEIGVKVYTIGVGSTGMAMSPVSRRTNGQYIFGMTKVEIDEALLRKIAQMTGGRYFRATSERALEEIYNAIDALEKTEIEVTALKRYSEEYRRFLWAGFAGLLFVYGMPWLVLRKMT